MTDAITFHKDDIDMPAHKKISSNSGNLTYEQYLLHDEDTGMMIKQIIYPKGNITPWHTHNCAHGMYVIRGTLHTNLGDFEAGSFVWWKEGSVGFHGGKDEDAECLFITNKPFNINYLVDLEDYKVTKRNVIPEKE